MTNFSILVIPLFVFVAMPAYSHSAPYIVNIDTAHQTVVSGEAVEIAINIMNLTHKDVFFNHVIGRNEAEFDYEIRVVNESGQQPPKSRYYQVLTKDISNTEPLSGGAVDGPITSSEMSTQLHPGESYIDGAVLSNLYDMIIPGTYYVQAIRKIPDIYGGGVVYSNVIKISVITPQ